MRFIAVERLAQAVFHVDKSYIDCSLKVSNSKSLPGLTLNDIYHHFIAASSSTPDVIRNTNPDEPSVPPLDSLEPVVQEAAPASEPEALKQKPKLVRRFGNRASSKEPSAPPVETSQTQAGPSTTGQPAAPTDIPEPQEQPPPPPKRVRVL